MITTIKPIIKRLFSQCERNSYLYQMVECIETYMRSKHWTEAYFQTGVLSGANSAMEYIEGVEDLSCADIDLLASICYQQIKG